MHSTRQVVEKQLFPRTDTVSTVGAVIGVLVCLVIIGFLCKIASRSSADPPDHAELIRRQQRERAYEVALQTLGEHNRRNDTSIDPREPHNSHTLQTQPPAYEEVSGS